MPNTSEDPCKAQTERNCTPKGIFTVGRKGGANHKNQKGDEMAWYVEFDGKGATGRGIGIHDSQLVRKGTPLSHGCVRTGNTEADKAYAHKVNANSRKGTVIVVDGKAPTKPWKQAVKKKAVKKPVKAKK